MYKPFVCVDIKKSKASNVRLLQNQLFCACFILLIMHYDIFNFYSITKIVRFDTDQVTFDIAKIDTICVKIDRVKVDTGCVNFDTGKIDK